LGSDNVWDGAYVFCINKDDGFTIRDADKSCDDKSKAGFIQKLIAAGINQWSFNP
jgi:hypothetical protein